MSQAADRLWTTLQNAGLVTGAAPALGAADTPWFVKTLLAFSGWLAAIFLLAFVGVGLAFLMESDAALLITGGVLIGGAFALMRVPKNEFVEHLALAISLAGQALIVVAIVRLTQGNSTMASLLVVLLAVLLAIVMPNFVHRVFSAFVAALAFAVVLASLRAPYLFSAAILLPAAWLWLNEFRFSAQIKTVQAVGYGLVLALILLEGAAALGFGHWYLFTDGPLMLWARPRIGKLLAAAVLLYVVWSLLKRHGRGLSGFRVALSLAAAAAVGVASLAATGIAVGMTILLLGFAGSNRVLLGLGVLSLLFYISSYYYTLHATLLAKSQTLLIIGLVLLAARWLMTRVVLRAGEAKHG